MKQEHLLTVDLGHCGSKWKRSSVHTASS